MRSRTPVSSDVDEPRPARGWLNAWLIIAWGVFCHLPAAGQSVSTATATIAGMVTDTTGAVLPGVTVSLNSPALMGIRETRTTSAGSFRFPALPPGTYTLTLALEGFSSVTREGIHLTAGFTATVDVPMGLQAFAEVMRVDRPAPVIDRHATSIAATFDATRLANLPGSRTMAAILSASPAVYVSRFDVGGSSFDTGSYGAYGTSGFNRPMVEGVSVTGIVATGVSLDFGSFEEVSVGTGAHGPEWHSPGVQMQFISKSGGNQYRGSIFADYGNRHWQSFNIDDDQVRRGASGDGTLSPRAANRLWRYHDVNADIGGFIKPDTLWWYFSIRDQDIAARQVNFPVEPQQTQLTNYTGKATYRMAPGHALVAFGQAGRNHQPFGLDPFGPAGSQLTGGSAINESKDSTSRRLSWGWIGKLEWNASVGEHSFLELRAGQFGANRAETPNGSAPRFEDVITLVVR